MRYGLCAGAGEPLPDQDIAEILGLGFDVIRQDAQPVTDPNQLPALIANLTRPGLSPLWIVRGAQLQHFPAGSVCELVNEPNLSFPDRVAMTPAEYAREWNTYAPAALARGITVYFGSISNLTRGPLDWLRTAWALADPKPTHVAFHRYPVARTMEAMTPHDGFGRRADELAALRAIVGDARLALTEFGYHTAPRRKWLFWTTRSTDAHVARQVAIEWQYARGQGLELAVLYQHTDGPTDTYLDRYGIRRDAAGGWAYKPVAYTVQQDQRIG